ncbi:acyltransferase [Vibrio lentus]|uniref:Acyltransferase n=1 Tax=Vibrio lentus TaxID=136468 RepID=A0A2N7C6G8_9VIBR|nr:hypothetical protein [Vibrio lentus]PME54415.1 hypothetical protein BCV34_21535 [Vibrio lentus]PME72261.1 hypothetical protein BCV30_21870 [Vibrio lentus]PME90109.1 hypothetical protein BCV27_22515 [Vibrio lentus]
MLRNKLLLLYSWLIWFATFFIPDTGITMRFRGFLYSLAMKKSGKNLQVSSGTKLYGLNSITVGDNVYIATNVVINAGGCIDIGSEVLIGIGAIIVSGNHTIKNGSYRFGTPQQKTITIGFGSWIAAGVVLVAGSSIPNSSLVTPNSVIYKTLDLPGIYSGSSIRKIK